MFDDTISLERDIPYIIRYYDHFEHDAAEEIIITEVGFFIGENGRYLFFASYKSSDGQYYNRTGILKSEIISIGER